MKVKVMIKETLSRIVEVEAESREDAEQKVIEMWCASEIVLDDGDFNGEPEITAI